MLLPKRTKFRRQHRGRFRGVSKANTIVFGDIEIYINQNGYYLWPTTDAHSNLPSNSFIVSNSAGTFDNNSSCMLISNGSITELVVDNGIFIGEKIGTATLVDTKGCCRVNTSK